MPVASPTARSALRLILVGAPGAGKGTQCKYLQRDFPSLVQLSTGNLLRDHMRLGTPLGQQAAALVQAGSLVPDTLVNDLVASELKARTASPLLLDGYPRTLAQAESLSHHTKITAVVNLDVPPSVIMDRILNRWVHPASGRVYNASYNPPKVAGVDDVTGEPLEQRADDTEEALTRRLQVYADATAPLLEFYARQGLLHSFKGNTSDEIYPHLRKLVAGLFKEH
ncbi:hypothetical protein GGF32_002035 [Allomyces javanicus]|nr:hypothetical protein GGF32_002035 [Allomyces javanicus]